jgi:hypothetical protein
MRKNWQRNARLRGQRPEFFKRQLDQIGGNWMKVAQLLVGAVVLSMAVLGLLSSTACAECSPDYVAAYRTNYNIDIHTITAETFFDRFCTEQKSDNGISVFVPIDDVTLGLGAHSDNATHACASRDFKYFHEFLEHSNGSFLDPNVAISLIQQCDGLTFVGKETEAGIELSATFRSGNNTAAEVTGFGIAPSGGAEVDGLNGLDPDKHSKIISGGVGALYSRKTQKPLVFSLQTDQGVRSVEFPGETLIPVEVYAYMSIDQKHNPGGYLCMARVAGGAQQVLGSEQMRYAGSLPIKHDNESLDVLSGTCILQYGSGVRIPAGTRRIEAVKYGWTIESAPTPDLSWRCKRNGNLVGNSLSFPSHEDDSEYAKAALCAEKFHAEPETK